MKQKLSLLRKIAEAACNRCLLVTIGGEKFEIGLSSEYVEVVHCQSRDSVESETVSELAYFVCCHSPYKIAVTDYHIYIQVVQEAIEYALSPTVGMDKISMKALIGSFAETQPEECEAFLKYLKTI